MFSVSAFLFNFIQRISIGDALLISFRDELLIYVTTRLTIGIILRPAFVPLRDR